MTHPAYIREKALQMRVERDLTIDEIAERLAISRQTIFHWVKDIPLKKPRRMATPAQAQRNRTNSLRYKALRDAAYDRGRAEYDHLIGLPTFRDFVCMYIGEGYKRSRNAVAICNSDPNVICLGEFWIRRFASNPVAYSLQYHVDQDLSRLRHAWADLLDIEEDIIRVQRKSNSNQLTGRNWRSRLAVMTIASSDTYFRARLQAWIDRTMSQWLDSIDRGV